MLMIVICDHTRLHVTEDRNSELGGGAGAGKDFFLLNLLDLSAPAGQTKECRFWGLCIGLILFQNRKLRRSLCTVNDRNTFIVYLPVSHELAEKKNVFFLIKKTTQCLNTRYKFKHLCIPLGFVCTTLFLLNTHSPAVFSAAYCQYPAGHPFAFITALIL